MAKFGKAWMVVYLALMFAPVFGSVQAVITNPQDGALLDNEWTTLTGGISGTIQSIVTGEIKIGCGEYRWDGERWVEGNATYLDLCSGNDCYNWTHRIPPPPTEGSCNVTLHGRMLFTEDYDTVVFHFLADPTPVTATRRYSGQWFAEYNIQGTMAPDFNVDYNYQLFHIGIDDTCEDLELNDPDTGNGQLTGLEPMAAGEKICVIVVNQFGKRSSAEAILPSPGVTIESPEEENYVNSWPTFHGTVEGYLIDSNLIAQLTCQNYCWDGNQWMEGNCTTTPVTNGSNWELNASRPSVLGSCRIRITHTTEARGNVSDERLFSFEKDYPEVDVAPVEEWEYNNGYLAKFTTDDVDGYTYHIYVATVERNEACMDYNYLRSASGEQEIEVPIDMDKKVCVKVVDEYNQESGEETVLPGVDIDIDEPLPEDYENQWPDDMVGSAYNWMVNSRTTFTLRCGDYWWNKENDEWEENSVENNLDVDDEFWDEIVTAPPVLGICELHVYHRDSERGEAEASVIFNVTKDAPTVSIEDPEDFEINGDGFTFEYWVFDGCLEGYTDDYCGDYNVYVAHVESNCDDAEYTIVGTFTAGDGQELTDRIVQGETVCVKAIDAYGQETVDETRIPHIDPRIEEPEANQYNYWPDMEGTWNQMDGDQATVEVNCEGWYWNGEDWTEEETSVQVTENPWTLDIPHPPVMGTCTIGFSVRSDAREEETVVKTFEFAPTPPSISVQLANGAEITNGCSGVSPECEKDIPVEINMSGWGEVTRMRATCGNGWIEGNYTTEENYRETISTSVRELNDILPGIYEDCMKEGNVELTIEIVDVFDRSAEDSDGVTYLPDAWKITYELSDGWNFIGIPFIPYTPAMERIEGNAESVWLFDARTQSWRVYWIEHPELSTVENFEQGKAYLIKVNGSASVTLWGHYEPETNTTPPAPSVIFTVYKGWNPVAFDLAPFTGFDCGLPAQMIDSYTALASLRSGEVYTMGRLDEPYEFGNRYHTVPLGVFGFPIYGTKGYWIYTTENNVDVHSKFMVDWGCP